MPNKNVPKKGNINQDHIETAVPSLKSRKKSLANKQDMTESDLSVQNMSSLTKQSDRRGDVAEEKLFEDPPVKQNAEYWVNAEKI